MELSENTLVKLRDLINEETIYRTGADLVKFFNQLGFDDKYGQGFPSRWMYTDSRLEILNNTSDMDKCIKKLFKPNNYIGHHDKLKKHINEFNEYLLFDGWQIELNRDSITFRRSLDSDWNIEENKNNANEEEFLKQNFADIDFSKLNIDHQLVEILESRYVEAKKSLQVDSPLATIFLIGSILEGILLSLAIKNPKNFNLASSSPKDKHGKVKQLTSWSLSELINVATEVGFIDKDIKKFSHAVRDYRNYIHPYQQLSENFSPTKHTAEICLQVLNAACSQIIMCNKNK